MSKQSISKLLTNKTFLYIVFAIVILNLFGYMIIGDLNFILFFILIALIVHMFTKNMIVILAVSLLIVSFTKGGFIVKEGLEGFTTLTPRSFFDKQKKNQHFKDHDISYDEHEYGSEGIEGLENMEQEEKEKEKEDNEEGTVEPMTGGGAPHTNSNIVANSSAASSIHGPVPESFEVGSKNKSQMGSRIDYSSTIEQAYDNLDKILGSDGIQRLTGDTQKLMEQQMKLAEAMKNMGPLLENANSMLNTINTSGGGIEKLLKNSGGIQNLLGNMGGKK
jgi:hypothetical protein